MRKIRKAEVASLASAMEYAKLNPGEEILFISPSWPAICEGAALFGLDITPIGQGYPCRLENGTQIWFCYGVCAEDSVSWRERSTKVFVDERVKMSDKLLSKLKCRFGYQEKVTKEKD